MWCRSRQHRTDAEGLKTMREKPVRRAVRDTAVVPSPRIETQIHRRKKAKAVSPLKTEWEESQNAPPVHLRMPPTASQPR